MSECISKPGRECRFHARKFGGAFCWWCARVIKKFCFKDGAIAEHCRDHNPESKTL